MITLPDLHDATFVCLIFEWETGNAELKFRASTQQSEMVRIFAFSTRRLLCPRANPWGPSVSVNGVSLSAIAGEQILKVEMQSGDVLEVHAADIQIAIE